MKHNLRRIFLNIYLLRHFYVPLSLLCIICSVVGMFVMELFQGALLLKEVSYIPYTNYYLVSVLDKNNAVLTNDNHLNKDGLAAISYLDFFENIDDIMISELCSANANLYRFNKDMSISTAQSGLFPWTIVSESTFDDSFRNAECFLVKGRHITNSDINAALIDIELAKANNIDIGDVFTTQTGDIFSVVGIYQTIKIDSVINNYLDIPNNMIFASNQPSDADIIDTYNLYVSFLFPYSPTEITQFSEKLTHLLASNNQTSYSLTSVEQLNKDSNGGVLSMLQLSVCCIIIMCVTIFIALYSFLSTFYRRRQKEFLLYNALGKKKKCIIIEFFFELSFIIIPSSVIGVLLCNGFFLRHLKNIISYFEKLVSIDTIFSTSTLSLNKTESISSGIYNQLQINHFAKDSFLFIFFFSLITCVCLLIINRASKKLSIIKMFSEK